MDQPSLITTEKNKIPSLLGELKKNFFEHFSVFLMCPEGILKSAGSTFLWLS